MLEQGCQGRIKQRKKTNEFKKAAVVAVALATNVNFLKIFKEFEILELKVSCLDWVSKIKF